MKKTLFAIMASVMMLGVGVFALTGCGEKTYDMSAFLVENKVVNYNGDVQGLALKNLPYGLKAKVTYYADEARTTVVENPIDAGTYYATISFEVEKGFKAVVSVLDTFTINKVDFAEDVDLSIKVGINETTTDENGDLHFAYKTINGIDLSKLSAENFVLTEENAKNLDVVAEYYSEAKIDENEDLILDEDGNPTFEDAKMLVGEAAKLSQVGNTVYGKFSVTDKNYNGELKFVKKIYMEQYKKVISTAEDLKQISIDLYEIPSIIRQNTVYELANDIDLEGAVWQTISPRYSNKEQIVEDTCFCSEFDGKDFTIKNFKLTYESLYYTIQADTDNNGVKEEVIVDGLYNISSAASYANLGFFGFAGYNSKLHNVKFENVDAQLDLAEIPDNENAVLPEDAVTPKAKVDMIHFGTLIGTLATMTSIYEEHSVSIYDVEVNGVKADLKGSWVFAGGIIGRDGMDSIEKNTSTSDISIFRKNLVVKDMDYTIQYNGAGRMGSFNIGGIVGEVQANDVLEFADCSAEGKVVVIAHDDAPETNYYNGLICLGSVVGEFGGPTAIQGFIHINRCVTDVAFEVYTNTENKGNVWYSGVWGHDNTEGGSMTAKNPDGMGCYNGSIGEDNELDTEDDEKDKIANTYGSRENFYEGCYRITINVEDEEPAEEEVID